MPMNRDDVLFKHILMCQKKYNKPDMHSFTIAVNGGVAFVECRQHEVLCIVDINGVRDSFASSAVAVCNRLVMLGADIDTISV